MIGDGGRLRVLIADDHAVVRHELRRLVAEAGCEVVGEVGTARDALSQATVHRPDVVLLDLDMPGSSGLTIIADLRERLPGCRVLVLTASVVDRDIRDALLAGASGYLTKDLSGAAIVNAIANQPTEMALVTTGAVAALLSSHPPPGDVDAADALSRLTPRQLEILGLLAAGLSAAEAARRTHLSVRTVEGYARSILARLGARNRVEAVRIFMAGGGPAAELERQPGPPASGTDSIP
jgi:two-component system, NarL family, response regulator DevR